MRPLSEPQFVDDHVASEVLVLVSYQCLDTMVPSEDERQ